MVIFIYMYINGGKQIPQMESVWLGSPVNPTRPLPSARSQEVVNPPGQREPGTDDHFLPGSKKLPSGYLT
jgi:hypothetical protein